MQLDDTWHPSSVDRLGIIKNLRHNRYLSNLGLLEFNLHE